MDHAGLDGGVSVERYFYVAFRRSKVALHPCALGEARQGLAVGCQRDLDVSAARSGEERDRAGSPTVPTYCLWCHDRGRCDEPTQRDTRRCGVVRGWWGWRSCRLSGGAASQSGGKKQGDWQGREFRDGHDRLLVQYTIGRSEYIILL